MYRVDFLETSHNDSSGFFFVVAFDLGPGHLGRARNRIVEVIGMGRPDVGNIPAGLSPCRSVGRVGVHDTAYFRKGFIKHKVCRHVGRRTQPALDDIPVEIDYHHIGGNHRLVTYTRRLDDN